MSRTQEIFGRPIEVEAFVIVPALTNRGRFAILANEDRMFFQEIEEAKLEIRTKRQKEDQAKMTYTIQEVSEFLEWFSTRICVG